MDITSLIVELISGAVGGNVAGAALKKYDLGRLWNSVVGIAGGGIGGQILGSLLGVSTGGGGLDIGTIASDIAGGGVGGAILMVIVGVIRQMMAK
jgi:hypothetical protein